MSSEQIKKLLAKLQDEIRTTELDEDTRSLVRQLDADIHQVLAAEDDAVEADGLVAQATELEAEFATRHPAAARFMREVIDTLVSMGI